MASMVFSQNSTEILTDFVERYGIPTDRETHNIALFYGLSVIISVFVTHMLTAGYICYQDVSGNWDRYKLLKGKRNTVWTYLQHVPSLSIDFVALLFPTLYVYALFYWKPLTAIPTFVSHYSTAYSSFQSSDYPSSLTSLGTGTYHLIIILSLAWINNAVNRLFAMTVHYCLHSPLLYKRVHKKHHCLITELCATSAWLDTYLEFYVMEVFGTFMFAQFFNPIHWSFQVMTALYNGFAGAIDHSGFFVPDTPFDGRYHFAHHQYTIGNYAELELWDKLLGSLIVRDIGVDLKKDGWDDPYAGEGHGIKAKDVKQD